VSTVQVVALRELDTLDVEDIHRPNDGKHGELIVEILIEVALAAEIVIGAGAEGDSVFQVVQAWPFPRRQQFELFLPGHDGPTAAARRLSLQPPCLVIAGDPAQGAVEMAFGALVAHRAEFVLHDTGLHPYAGRCRATDGRG